LQDDSGVITLTLWNEQADEFQVGDNVKVSNGYVNEWQGEKQLTAGKFGKLEKVEGEVAQEEKTAQDENKEDDLKSDKGEHIVSDDEKTEADVSAGDLNKPEIQDSVTPDEKVERDVVAGEKKPSAEESVTDDEIVEEEISVEEEDIQ